MDTFITRDRRGDESQAQPSCSSSSSSAGTSSTSSRNPWPYVDPYYKFVKVDGKNIIFECKECKPKSTVISANVKTLFNLKRHIERHHKSKYSDFGLLISNRSKKRALDEHDETNDSAHLDKRLRGKSQTTIEKALSISATQETINRRIINVFTENYLPFSVVESSSFKNLISTLAPSRTVMSRRTLVRKLEEEYSNCSQNLKNNLSRVTTVATTADIWSCRKRSYLGMTVHYIDPTSLERKMGVLACRRLKGRHTYDVVAKEIEMIHVEYGIENKVCSTTTDNASNFVKAFDVFQDNAHNDADDSEEDEDGDPDNEETEEDENTFADVHQVLSLPGHGDPTVQEGSLPPHRRCAAHTVNLVAVNDSNKNLSNSLRKMKNVAIGKAYGIWNKQSRSTVAADIIKEKLGTVLEVPTQVRWNSMYKSVSCLHKLLISKRVDVNNVCSALHLPLFSQSEINFLGEYSTVMAPIANCLNVLQGEENAYLGILAPSITLCIKKLQKMKESGPEPLKFCGSLIDALIAGLKKRFASTLDDENVLLASALHPQIKLGWLTDQEKVKEIEGLLVCKWEEFESLQAESGTGTSDSSEDSAQSGDDGISDFFKELRSSKNTSRSNTTAARSVHDYLNADLAPLSSVIHSSQFKALFIKYNTPIPSSASVERLFSMAKDVLRPKRSKLTDKNFEMMLFLNASSKF